MKNQRSKEELDEAQEDTITTYQKLRDKVLSPLMMQPQLPNVAPIRTTQAPVDPLSPERLDFAERIAGRPVV